VRFFGWGSSGGKKNLTSFVRLPIRKRLPQLFHQLFHRLFTAPRGGADRLEKSRGVEPPFFLICQKEFGNQAGRAGFGVGDIRHWRFECGFFELDAVTSFGFLSV